MVIDHVKQALIVNALREKAAGDREAIAASISAGGFPPEVDVLNGAAGRLAATLEKQAVDASALADEIENANRITLEG